MTATTPLDGGRDIGRRLDIHQTGDRVRDRATASRVDVATLVAVGYSLVNRRVENSVVN